MSSYFTQDTFQFLRDLEANNSKEWMDENRERYHLHRDKVIEFARDIYDSFATVDTMPVVDTKKSIARINNNRKFHPDRPPYKNNFAVMVNRGEGKCGFYIHIEPANSFVGGGIYHPEREKLEAVRANIDQNGAELQRIVDSSTFKKYFGSLDGDELKTSPRDYSQDHEYIHFLRKKDLIIYRSFTNKDFLEDNVVEEITRIYKAGLPFLRFIDDSYSVYLA